MAVAYASHASTAFTSINGVDAAVTITKPASLAAGDLMVAIVAIASGTNFNSSEATWTALGEADAGAENIYAYYKVADAGDAAASDFTITVSTTDGGANDYIAGVIIRFTGTAPITGTGFADTGSDTDGGAGAYTGGVDPRVADNILVLGAIARDAAGGGANSVTGYAVTTSDPTWTERLDTAQTTGGGVDYCFGVATGPRAASTATGNFSATFDGDVDDSVGVLVAVIETTNVSPAPAVVTVTASVQAPSIVGTASVTPSVITLTASVPAPAVATAAPEWANATKSSAPSWSNMNKS